MIWKSWTTCRSTGAEPPGRRGRFTLLLLALLLSVGPTSAEDESPKAKANRLVREFHELRKSPDWENIKKRRDLIIEMGETPDPASLPTLLEAFVKDREQLCRIQAEIALGKRGTAPFLTRMITAARAERDDVFLMALPLSLRHSHDPEIGAWIRAKLLPMRKPPTARPAAIECLGLLGEQSALKPLREILEEDRDVRVLYETLLAVARIAGPAAEEDILPFLDHEEVIVRQAAVEALGEIDSDASTAKLLAALAAGEPRVKEAAATALAARKHEAAIPRLIDELIPNNGLRVRDTVRRALKALTGEDHGVDAEAWRAWRRRKESGQGDPGDDPGTHSVPTYWTMPVYSDRVLFIVDISGSMDAGKPQRIETARAELKKTLERLDRKTIFNIVAFGSGPRSWESAEVPATKENIASAMEWVDKLSVGGGTNVYDTFEQALEQNLQIDTIFFLGDGSPSVGKYTEQEEILVRIRWMNRFRKIRIHTIALLRGEVARFGGRNSPGAAGRFRSISGPRYFDKDEAARFLSELAKEHGGDFVEIRK